MFKTFFTVFVLLIPAALGLAQTPAGHIKEYSGYFHHFTLESKPFWASLLSKSFPQQEITEPAEQCSIEFISSFPLNQPVTRVPSSLKYTVKFHGDNLIGKDFMIRVYTNDDQEYTIDPAAEGERGGVEGLHKVSDTYLIYLILAEDKIKRLEVAPPSGMDKYVLDQWHVRP